MEQGDRARLQRVKEGIHQVFLDFGVGDLYHGLEQGEHFWGVIPSTERTGEVPRMLGEKV